MSRKDGIALMYWKMTLQELRLHNACLLADQSVRLDPPMPRIVKRLLLALSALCEVNLRDNQFVLRGLGLGKHMTLRTHDRAATDEIVFVVIEATSGGGYRETGIHVRICLLRESRVEESFFRRLLR